uniref:Uncharacterized protein n=1 Tax=Fervidobacterium nodosum TaxID=2424 RepID=A0A7C5U346_9BACT
MRHVKIIVFMITTVFTILLLTTCNGLTPKPSVKLQVISPKENSIISGQGKIIIQVEKADLVRLIEIFVSNKKVGEISSPPFEFEFDTKDFPSGKNTILVKALLQNNQILTSSVNITIDNPPQIVITNPVNGTIISTEITLQATATDDFEVKKVEFYSSLESEGLKLISSVTNSVNGYYQTKWYPEKSGNYTIIAKAHDNVGNVGETIVNLVVDKTAPVVKIVSPKAGELLSPGSIPIVVEAYDDYTETYSKIRNKGVNSFNCISKVEFFVNNTKIGEKEEEPFVLVWDSSKATPNDYTIRVKAYDLYNNFAESSVSVKLSDTLKVLITQPTENSLLNGIFTIKVNAQSPSGVKNVKFFLDNLYIGIDETEPYELSIDSRVYNQGEHTIKVEAIDKNGKVSSAQVKVIFRKFIVCGDFGITENIYNDTYNWDNAISETFGTEWKVADWNDIKNYFNNGGNLAALFDGLGILKSQSVWCKLNGYQSNYFGYPFYRTLFYRIERTEGDNVSAGPSIDGLNNNFIRLGAWTGQNKVLAYRKTPLTEKYVTIKSLKNNEIVFGTRTISLEFSEGFKPKKVKFYLNNTLLSTVSSEPFEYVLNTSTITPGTYRFSVLAEGTDFTNYYDSVIIEIPSFSVQITSPTKDSYLSGIVEVQLNASDTKNLLDRIELYVDDTKLSEISSSPYKFQINTKNYPDGTHVLLVKYYSKDGKYGENSVTTVFDNTLPTVNILSPTQNSIINGIFDVRTSIGDNISLSKLELFVDELKESQITIEGTNTTKTTQLDTKKYVSGYHNLKVGVTDKANNYSEKSIKVLIDQPPSVQISNPASGTNISGTFNVLTNIKDDFRVTKVSMYVDNQKIEEKTVGPFDFSYTVGDAPNKQHTISIEAIDNSNNTSQENIIVTFWKLYQDFESTSWKSVFENYQEGSTDTGKVPIIVTVPGSSGVQTKALKLGGIADNKEIWFSFNATLNRNATISFKYKVSSEQTDVFEFFVKNEKQLLEQNSGQSLWLSYTKELAAGTYSFKFLYKKDIQGSQYDDCVYIDEVNIKYKDQ